MSRVPAGPWEDPRVRAGLKRQLAARRRLLEAGARPIGWKVGFGAPASLDMMEITAPLLGFLTDATSLPNGSSVDVTSWERGIVEFEVAVLLGADVTAGTPAAEAARAVAGIAPAIELANIDLPLGPDAVSDIVAGNIFHQNVILGDADMQRRALDISGLVAAIATDGEPHSTTHDLQAMTGQYPEIVATVATTLASQGETLRRGDLIITGSVIAPIPVSAGREFTFTLRPLPPISVIVEQTS